MAIRKVLVACLLLVCHQSSALSAAFPADTEAEIAAVESHLQPANIIRGETPTIWPSAWRTITCPA